MPTQPQYPFTTPGQGTSKLPQPWIVPNGYNNTPTMPWDRQADFEDHKKEEGESLKRLIQDQSYELKAFEAIVELRELINEPFTTHSDLTKRLRQVQTYLISNILGLFGSRANSERVQLADKQVRKEAHSFLEGTLKTRDGLISSVFQGIIPELRDTSVALSQAQRALDGPQVLIAYSKKSLAERAASSLKAAEPIKYYAWWDESLKALKGPASELLSVVSGAKITMGGLEIVELEDDDDPQILYTALSLFKSGTLSLEGALQSARKLT